MGLEWADWTGPYQIGFGVLCAAVGLFCALYAMGFDRLWRRSKAEGDEMPSDKPVYQNHYGVGHNINADTVNLGRQEFVLTQDILEQLAQHFSGSPAVVIHWVGSQRSKALSEQVGEFLDGRGIKAIHRGGIMMYGNPNAGAIHVEGNVIYVDADK